MYDYSLSDFIELKQMVEIQEAYEIAAYKDEEVKLSALPRRKQ